MKNVPKNCTVCKTPLIYRSPCDIQCSLSIKHFYAHITSNVISFWAIDIIVDGNAYSLFSEVSDKLVSVRDSSPINYLALEDDGIILSANIWFPYITGKALDSSRKLVKQLLKLKAFI